MGFELNFGCTVQEGDGVTFRTFYGDRLGIKVADSLIEWGEDGTADVDISKEDALILAKAILKWASEEATNGG